MPVGRRDHGRAPGSKPLGLALVAQLAARFFDLPDILAGLLVQGDEERALARAETQDHQIAIQDG